MLTDLYSKTSRVEDEITTKAPLVGTPLDRNAADAVGSFEVHLPRGAVAVLLGRPVARGIPVERMARGVHASVFIQQVRAGSRGLATCHILFLVDH